MDAPTVVVILIFVGVCALAVWYHRVYLGNPPDRWHWLWPGFLTLALLGYALYERSLGYVALTAIAGIVTIVEYRAYRRHAERRDADARQGTVSGDGA